MVIGFVDPSRPGRGSGCHGPVDLHQVERAGGEVQFAERPVHAPAGESVEDFLEVPGTRFDCCSTTFIEGDSFGCAEPMRHRLSGCRSCWRRPGDWLLFHRGCLGATLAQRDQPVGAGRGKVTVTAVTGVGKDAPHLVPLVRAGATFSKGKLVERNVDTDLEKEAA